MSKNDFAWSTYVSRNDQSQYPNAGQKGIQILHVNSSIERILQKISSYLIALKQMSSIFQGLATTVVINKKFQWSIPYSWSLIDAATVPVAFATAYYALVVRGRIKHGERILIHSGSGGVGQAAIAVALSHGCEVFTTVGSNEKKAFLQNKFPQLKDQNFSSSRSTEFANHFMEITKGKGRYKMHLLIYFVLYYLSIFEIRSLQNLNLLYE